MSDAHFDSNQSGSGPEDFPIRPLRTDDPEAQKIRRFFLARNFEVMGEIGRGGMGIVYLARDVKLGRPVAIKTLSPERKAKQSSVLRFEREARTFAAIRHANIANLYEFSDDGEYQFLALEYIEGTDLDSERRKGRKWKPEDVALLVQKMAEALDYTHAKGILHRDIKPGNILIEKNTNRFVLTDFGLAKGNNDITLTASGYAVGTPAYMAPEQISDQFGSKPDGRADLFSLGTVAYEMLTGKHPFLEKDDMSTMRAIVQRQPASPRSMDPSVPEELEKIILKTLEKRPENRPATGKVLADMMAAFLDSRKHGNRTPTPAPLDQTPAPYGSGATPIPSAGQAYPPAAEPKKAAPPQPTSTEKTEPAFAPPPKAPAPAATPVQPPASAPPPQSSNSGKMMLIYIGFAVVLVVGILIGVLIGGK